MKKVLFAVVAGVVLVSGYAFAARVHDWHALDKVHKHTLEALHEMEAAQKANNYDMQGHGAKADADLRDAEKELGEAVEAIRSEK